jgi:hypothetical protein
MVAPPASASVGTGSMLGNNIFSGSSAVRRPDLTRRSREEHDRRSANAGGGDERKGRPEEVERGTWEVAELGEKGTSRGRWEVGR